MLNQQKPESRHKDFKEAQELEYVDLFRTVQGEGPFTGYPAIFFRLAGCNLQCPMCFVGETLITMENGTQKPIKDIVVGDRVMSFADCLVSNQVTDVMSRTVSSLTRLVLSGREGGSRRIYTTPEHPFLTNEKDWVPAGNLEVGMHVVGPNGWSTVQQVVNNLSVSDEDGVHDDVIRVFNLTVENSHTYIAGDCIVHNCDTNYTTDRRMTSVGVVAKSISEMRKFPSDIVVITGGEPFRQHISPLIRSLILDYNMTVQIETNGVYGIPDDVAAFIDAEKLFVVVSPKTNRIHASCSRASAFKYVIDAGSVYILDGLPTTALGHKAVPILARPPAGWEGPVYVNPADEKDANKNLANLDAALESALKFGYVIGVQMHKILDLP